MNGWEDGDEIDRLNSEVQRLTNALLEVRGYLKLWTDDVAAGLAPTSGSLSDARHLVTVALEGGSK